MPGGFKLYPRRFMVNITNHLDWYLPRNVDITAVLSLRDATISHKSKLSDHCHVPFLAKEEDNYAIKLMREALLKYGSNGEGRNQVVTVSYEGLMQFKETYLF